MKITKIEINGFGKFHNKVIELNDGINVLYGKNEAGKSTLHKFIEGVFFGFFNPYTKNKIYTAEYDKYMPWVGEDYRGALEYELDSKMYRLERCFSKNNESIKLFDLLTGEDITYLLSYDPVIKQFSIKDHIGVNKVVFKNTLSISQNDIKTNDDLSKEINGLIANFVQSGDNRFSVKKAIKYLNNKKNEIGTKRQSKSEYGLSVTRLNLLENEKTRIENIASSNKEKYLKIKELKKILNELKTKKTNIQLAKKNNDILFYKEKLEEYNLLDNEEKGLREQMKELTVYQKVTSELYQEYSCAEGRYNEVNKNINSYKNRIHELEKEINVLQQKTKEVKNENGINFVKLQRDYAVLKDCNESLKRLEAKKLKEKGTDNKEKVYKKNIGNNENIFLIGAFSLLAIGVLLCLISLIAEIPLLFYILGATALSVALLVVYFILHSKNKNANEEIEIYNTELRRTDNMITLNRIEIKRILDEYEADGCDELLTYFEEQNKIKDELSEDEIKLEKYKSLYEDLNINYDNAVILKKQYYTQMQNILKSAKLESEAQLEIALDKKEKYNILKSKCDNIEQLKKQILSSYTLEQLKELSLREIVFVDEEYLPIADYDEEMLSLTNQITDLSSSISRLTGEVNESEKDVRDLAQVEEEIYYYEEKVKDVKEKINALDTAISVLEEVSKGIHFEIAPVLNKQASDIISSLTGGKYKDVKISEDLNIKVMDNELNKLIDVNELSMGSIDQLYFALRLSIINTVLPKYNLPVFLDECFSQYDDERLNNIIKYIACETQKRQVLIFTCHKREQNALNKINEEYNLINI